MAIYHCSVKIIGRSQGRSAVGSAAYRAGEIIRNERDGITHDYSRKGGIVHTEILTSAHAIPEWAKDRARLWNEVEKSEKRIDAQTAREVEVALPLELSREKQIELLREFAKENFTDKGMVADVCLHDKGEGNPHAHIMLTTRNIDENGFTNKNRAWNKKELLENWRKSWAEKANLYLEREGFKEKIDHRSYEAQGIEKIPTRHLGANIFALEKKGVKTELGDVNRKIKEIENIRAEIISMEKYLESKAKRKEESRQPIRRSVAEIRALCDQLINETSQTSKTLLEKYKQGKGEEITNEKALQMALSLFYKGAYEKIIENIKNREAEENKLNEKVSEFNAKPTPSFFNFSKQKEHQKEHDRLMKIREELIERKRQDDKKYSDIIQDMNRPEVNKQIYTIRDKILKL